MFFLDGTWTLMLVRSPLPSLLSPSRREYFAGNSPPASVKSMKFPVFPIMQFLHLCVQKVVEAVLEEEVEEDGGDVGLRHGLVHWGMVRCQQCRDEPAISQ